jgi:hypothetical protein
MTAAMTSGSGGAQGRCMPGGAHRCSNKDLKIGIAQRPELVDETDAGKELRVPFHGCSIGN